MAWGRGSRPVVKVRTSRGHLQRSGTGLLTVRSYCDSQSLQRGQRWGKVPPFLYSCQPETPPLLSAISHLLLQDSLYQKQFGSEERSGAPTSCSVLELSAQRYKRLAEVPLYKDHTRRNRLFAMLWALTALSVSFCNLTNTLFQM